ncbi:MAG: ABC transporter ATP-binding protein [Treponema sp.]|jgi:NitT/TauT family transport system ATP-binding protein|nr:ABC transporter ATP-binding protein [Treponema sp.]
MKSVDFIQITNLSITRNNKDIFKNFSTDIAKNSICGVFGKSGCGKTTLLDWLSGLLKNDERIEIQGKLTFFDNKIHQISYVFQDQRLLPSISIEKNISIPMEKHFTNQEIKQKCEEIILFMGLHGKENKFPGELSGGERQRVSIARAFLFPSDVLLLDEPFHFLDDEYKKKIQNQIKSFVQNEEKTVILVSHEKDDINSLCSSCIYEKDFIKEL